MARTHFAKGHFETVGHYQVARIDGKLKMERDPRYTGSRRMVPMKGWSYSCRSRNSVLQRRPREHGNAHKRCGADFDAEQRKRDIARYSGSNNGAPPNAGWLKSIWRVSRNSYPANMPRSGFKHYCHKMVQVFRALRAEVERDLKEDSRQGRRESRPGGPYATNTNPCPSQGVGIGTGLIGLSIRN